MNYSTLLPLLALAARTGATRAAPPSGCDVCAAYGQCDAAFRHGPGQFCGAFYDGSTAGHRPCCCPLQAACKVSPTQCLCHISERPPPPRPAANTQHGPSHSTNDGGSTLSGVAPFLVMAVLVLGCWCCCCRRREDPSGDRHHRHASQESVPVVKAVPAVAVPATNPDYYAPSAPSYGSTHDGTQYDAGSGGGTGAGTAIASGLGGFVAGTLVGDLIGRNTAGLNNTQQGSGVGNSGGYDVVADAGGGFDFAGDSGDNGGGGYDIAGDDGGYDIEGDS